jgi:lysyl-tRNA synthetase class 1
VDYEFLNIGGRKMSTSRGHGAAAHEMAEVVPPEQLRLLFVRPRPNHAIDFDPVGTDAVPRLFDEFDRIAAASAGREVRGELPAHHERVFAAALPDPNADVAAEGAAYRVPFNHLGLLLQVPGVDLLARVSAEKGSALTEHESALLAERMRAALAWLEAYAPDRAHLEVQREGLPPAAQQLDTEQRAFLAAVASRLAEASGWDGEGVQAAIFDAAKQAGLPAGHAFAAIYAAFLGQESGPRAGWLLAALEPEFVIDRLRAAAEADTLTP